MYEKARLSVWASMRRDTNHEMNALHGRKDIIFTEKKDRQQLLEQEKYRIREVIRTLYRDRR